MVVGDGGGGGDGGDGGVAVVYSFFRSKVTFLEGAATMPCGGSNAV